MQIPFTPQIIATAYRWICARRQHYSPNNDIWDLCHFWEKKQIEIEETLQQDRYKFSPRQQHRFKEETISLYSSADSLVLKSIQLILSERVQQSNVLSPHCYHLKGNGGIKAAVNATAKQITAPNSTPSSDTTKSLRQYRYVFKSDIKGYYANINHDALALELLKTTQDASITNLIMQSLKTPSTWGGLYYDHEIGIPRGSPLSPLLGAIALKPLDEALGSIPGVFYARYMDDWVLLCKSRHQLRKIVKITHKILNALQLKLHPDKTFIGKIEKGFDFLGYHFTMEELSLATITQEKAMIKIQQLYEQGATLKRIVDYWKRFMRWACAAVNLSALVVNTLEKLPELLRVLRQLVIAPPQVKERHST
jgi:RNA-directed DNA polymerase